MTEAEREAAFPGIEEYVHVAMNLEAGNYDQENGWVRFGSRHNDIYPRIGDLIRFAVGLKPRPAIAISRKKAAAALAAAE